MAEHIRANDAPNRDAFNREWREFQASPRYRKTAYTELEAAMIYSYALAACAYVRPNCATHVVVRPPTRDQPTPERIAMPEHGPAWPTGERGAWAGGNTFRSDLL